MKDSTKAKIDAMTTAELEWEVENESKSIFRTNEKRKYLAERLSELKAEESLQRHRENIEVQKSAAISNKKHNPVIQIAIGVTILFIAACLIFIFRTHLGIPL